MTQWKAGRKRSIRDAASRNATELVARGVVNRDARGRRRLGSDSVAMTVKQPGPTAQAVAVCPQCATLRMGLSWDVDWASLLNHIAHADAFELFGLSPGYNIDERALADVSRSIHRNIHPDRMPRGDQGAQAFAMRASAIVNQALATLKDSRLRAEYLLARAGGKSASEDKQVPIGLLAEMMMIREELEEARAAGDAIALQRIMRDAIARRDETEKHIARLCGQLNPPAADLNEVRSSLRMHLNAMKYHTNLVSECESPSATMP